MPVDVQGTYIAVKNSYRAACPPEYLEYVLHTFSKKDKWYWVKVGTFRKITQIQNIGKLTTFTQNTLYK